MIPTAAAVTITTTTHRNIPAGATMNTMNIMTAVTMMITSMESAAAVTIIRSMSMAVAVVVTIITNTTMEAVAAVTIIRNTAVAAVTTMFSPIAMKG